MVFESSHCYIVHRPDFPTPNLFNSPDSFDPTLLSWRSTTQRRNQNICQFGLFCILSLNPSKYFSLKTKQHLSLRLWLWFCMVLSSREMWHDVHLEQLALLGLTTLLEVYSVVLWFFFITFWKYRNDSPMVDLVHNLERSTSGSKEYLCPHPTMPPLTSL